MVIMVDGMVRSYALGLFEVHGGFLEAYAFTEYILMRIEQRICVLGMRDNLMEEYGFYCDVLDYIDAMIKMN